jgi:hypothetical protein
MSNREDASEYQGTKYGDWIKFDHPDQFEEGEYGASHPKSGWDVHVTSSGVSGVHGPSGYEHDFSNIEEARKAIEGGAMEKRIANFTDSFKSSRERAGLRPSPMQSMPWGAGAMRDAKQPTHDESDADPAFVDLLRNQ